MIPIYSTLALIHRVTYIKQILNLVTEHWYHIHQQKKHEKLEKCMLLWRCASEYEVLVQFPGTVTGYRCKRKAKTFVPLDLCAHLRTSDD